MMEITTVFPGMIILLLTFHGTHSESFTLLGNGSRLKTQHIWNTDISTRPLILEFRFRTLQPNSLLLQEVFVPENDNQLYSIELYLKQGRLHIRHSVGARTEEHDVGKGLTHDKWHAVKFTQDFTQNTFLVEVDLSYTEYKPSMPLRDNNKGMFNITFGDYPSKTMTPETNSFIGCLDITKKQSAPELEKHNVQEGCKDACLSHNPCHNQGKCLNRYTYTECDCYKTGFRGQQCTIGGTTVITLQGYQWIKYKLFENSHNKVHRPTNRISLEFKTTTEDGLLLYMSGKDPILNYLVLWLSGGVVKGLINFGDDPREISLTPKVNDDRWHEITVSHRGISVNITLDGSTKQEHFTWRHHFHLDPDVYIGGGDTSKTRPAFPSTVNFTGCIQNVFFNHVPVLDKLNSPDYLLVSRNDDPSASYYGPRVLHDCLDLTEPLPLSITTEEAVLPVDVSDMQGLHLEFEFRTLLKDGVLMDIPVQLAYRDYNIKLLMKSSRFILMFSNQNITVGNNLNDGKWHQVRVLLIKIHLHVYVDHHHIAMTVFQDVKYRNNVYIGGDARKGKDGFVGCLRNITIEGKALDPGSLRDLPEGIIVDGCKLVNQCNANIASLCEHGTQCMSLWTDFKCDCRGTGYDGKTCHFAQLPSTCEYYQLQGFQSGVQPIDIDGSGPFPPAYVYCGLSGEGEPPVTLIPHNLPRESVVRNPTLRDHRRILSYRSMTSDMLLKLVEMSRHCEQTVTYSCNSSSLDLQHSTLFYTNDKIADSQCTSCEKCMDKQPCTCDINEPVWKRDHIKLSSVPVTELTFYQHENGGSANITVGPLKCEGHSGSREKNAFTFRTPSAYIQFPNWKKGSLQFWFRTVQTNGILLYQAPTISQKNYFQISLADDTTVHFNFTINGKFHHIVLNTSVSLSNSQWHHLSVEYSQLDVRFKVDKDAIFWEYDEVMNFPSYSGSMYVGGRPDRPEEGFMGCMSELMFNDKNYEVPGNLGSSGILKGCKSSCEVNPCLNDGACIEMWGIYKCQCKYPHTQLGFHCETDINTDTVTFKSQESSLMFEDVTLASSNTSEIVFSFRTHSSDALLLYASFQEEGDLVMMKIELVNGSKVVFTMISPVKEETAELRVPGLNNGMWRQVVITRGNQNEAQNTLQVDDYFALIKTPSRTSRQREDALVASVMSRLYIGGGPRTASDLPGLFGCIRGVKIGGQVYNLKEASSQSLHVAIGCHAGCQSVPCFNGGMCIEQWGGQFKCDCTKTMYGGKTCSKETGASFDGKSMVQETLAEAVSVSQQETINLVFTATTTMTRARVLISIMSETRNPEYILLFLTPEGTIRLDIDVGFGLHILQIPGVFTDGKQHKLEFKRKKELITLKVDHLATQITLNSHFDFDRIRYVMVGGMNGTKKAESLHRFIGCIANVVYQLSDYTTDRPLDEFLGLKEESVNTITISGTITPSTCYTPHVQYTPEIIELYEPSGDISVDVNVTDIDGEQGSNTFPPWETDSADIIYINTTDLWPVVAEDREIDHDHSKTTIIASVLLVVMIIAAAVIAFVLCRKRKQMERAAAMTPQKQRGLWISFRSGERKEESITKPNRTSLVITDDTKPSKLNLSENGEPKENSRPKPKVSFPADIVREYPITDNHKPIIDSDDESSSDETQPLTYNQHHSTPIPGKNATAPIVRVQDMDLDAQIDDSPPVHQIQSFFPPPAKPARQADQLPNSGAATEETEIV